MLTFFKILTTIMGVAMSFGYYLQAYRIWKNRSSKNISVPTYVIFAFGTMVWTVYGILINDIAVILGFTLGVIGSWLVLCFIYIFRE